MPAIGRLERFAVEPEAVDRQAVDDGVQDAVLREIRAELLIAAGEAELGLNVERLLTFAAQAQENLDPGLDAQGARRLHAAAAVVVAIAPPRPERGEARLVRRHLPSIVGR